MEALKSYLFTAMLAALASSIVIRVSDPRHRTYIRFGAGLCLLLLLTAPLIGLAGEITDSLDAAPPPAETTGESAFLGEMGSTMSRQIGDLVAGRYGIDREEITVKITLDLADLSAITLVRVDVTIAADCDKMAIETYLSDSLGCPVTVDVQMPIDEEKEIYE